MANQFEQRTGLKSVTAGEGLNTDPMLLAIVAPRPSSKAFVRITLGGRWSTRSVRGNSLVPMTRMTAALGGIVPSSGRSKTACERTSSKRVFSWFALEKRMVAWIS